ncbi:T6SS immunity protein Tli4 family protein [Paraburkholderia bonniea]|uniref:T6SS immunity protein Tli4 family protein n=1 Tax=Paraburkholderia bonniea TaxID=2152891 RepID=UPI001C2B80FF|nr:T6SS immunity protein Tli4 family protein [Paraburkholderia bonniea]
MSRYPNPSRVLRASLFFLMCSLSACVWAGPLEPVMTNNPLLADPRPWCIGRLVIDRTVHGELSYEKYEYWGDKIEITHGVSAGAFQHKVSMRENELRTKKRTILISYKESVKRGLPNGIVETDVPWLEQSTSPTHNSRLLIFKEDSGRPDALLTQEVYVLAGSTMLVMTHLLRHSDIQRSIQLSTDVYPYITHRDNWSIPTERGFCIDGALIGGPSRNSELAEQTIVLQPGRPSAFVIKTRSALDIDQQASLLKSLPELRRTLREQGYGSVQILREGKRQVAGMEVEEVLFSIKEGAIQLFRFYLLMPGVYHSTLQPHTEIQLMLGDALTDADKSSGVKPDEVSSPVDEAGALEVWDTLLNSLRVRPGAL